MILGDFANRFSEATFIYIKDRASRIFAGDDTPSSFALRKERFLQNRAALKQKLIELSEGVTSHGLH